MIRIKRVFGLLPLILVFCFLASAYSQTELPLSQPEIISVVGRLALEKHGKGEWLVLHSKDASTYTIIGDLRKNLMDSLIELGQNNLVSVMGRKTGPYSTACSNTYKYDAKGNRKIETVCIRYYDFEITQIIEAKKSDEALPPPKRDAKEEKRAFKMALNQLQNQPAAQIITIEGTVSSLNLKSPIKTIVVTYLDKDKQKIKKTLLLSSITRVAKAAQETGQEPMYLGFNALKAGQKVTVVYARDELKSEALFITITKE